jgi:hypothetical protein
MARIYGICLKISRRMGIQKIIALGTYLRSGLEGMQKSAPTNLIIISMSLFCGGAEGGIRFIKATATAGRVRQYPFWQC